MISSSDNLFDVFYKGTDWVTVCSYEYVFTVFKSWSDFIFPEWKGTFQSNFQVFSIWNYWIVKEA